MSKVPAIRIDRVNKVYRKAWRRAAVSALNDVSLVVDEGEAFGFIGPNGAGKSTTIRILTGLAAATSGEVSLFGISVKDERSRVGLGYVPESPYLYDYLTPLEILLMGMSFHQVKVADRRAHCLRWLERLGLGKVATTTIRQFSKGMTQRVAIAQALAIQPRMLILDEPLSGLDPVGRRDVVDILAEYKQGGGTLFFTSHVLHDVERLADRFGLLHQGELRAVRAPGELVGDQEVLHVRTYGTVSVTLMREDFPGRWVGEVQRKELWALLHALETSGHTLIEVRPALSLEAAFLRVVQS